MDSGSGFLALDPLGELMCVLSLLQNTTNGDVITVNGQSYVVKSTVIRYKLQRGRYRPCHKRLDVMGTTRYIYNLYAVCLLNDGTGDHPIRLINCTVVADT